MVENRLVGVKSRECYSSRRSGHHQCAQGARDALPRSRNAALQVWHRTKVGNGRVRRPVVFPAEGGFDSFCASTQAWVTGTVKVKLYKGSSTVLGRKSPYSLYDFLVLPALRARAGYVRSRSGEGVHPAPWFTHYRMVREAGPAAKEMAEQSALPGTGKGKRCQRRLARAEAPFESRLSLEGRAWRIPIRVAGQFDSTERCASWRCGLGRFEGAWTNSRRNSGHRSCGQRDVCTGRSGFAGPCQHCRP